MLAHVSTLAKSKLISPVLIYTLTSFQEKQFQRKVSYPRTENEISEFLTDLTLKPERPG